MSRIADQAAATAEALDSAAIGDIRIATDGRTVEQVADAITSRTGWPHPSPEEEPQPPSLSP